MDEEIDVRYLSYLSNITATMINETSLMAKQKTELNDLFLKFGFTNEEVSKIAGEVTAASTQFINQYATMGAIELIKEGRQQELIAAQIKKIEAEVLLVEAQIKQAENQADLIESQKDLIKRQVKGYDDNIISKAAEFQGGLASFAVNAGSDDAQGAINEFLCTIEELKNVIEGYEEPTPKCPAED